MLLRRAGHVVVRWSDFVAAAAPHDRQPDMSESRDRTDLETKVSGLVLVSRVWSRSQSRSPDQTFGYGLDARIFVPTSIRKPNVSVSTDLQGKIFGLGSKGLVHFNVTAACCCNMEGREGLRGGRRLKGPPAARQRQRRRGRDQQHAHRRTHS